MNLKLLFLANYLFMSNFALGQSTPIFHRVIIASSVGNNVPQSEAIIKASTSSVYESRRFDVVKEFFDVKDRNKDLQSIFVENDADGVFYITAVPVEDSIEVHWYLLDRQLQTWAAEKRRIEISQEPHVFINTSKESVLSLMNQLPFDVQVSSVQGRVVTLTAGSDQNISEGDKFSLIKVDGSKRNNRDGSVVAWSTHVCQEMVIRQVNEHSSIGIILSSQDKKAFYCQVSEGDGFKNHKSLARGYFVQQDYGTSEVEEEVAPSPQSWTPPAQAIKLREPIPTATPAPTLQVIEQMQIPAAEPNVEGESTDSTEDARDDSEVSKVMNILKIRAVYFDAGPSIWSVSGPISTSSKMSWWLLNEFSVRAEKQMDVGRTPIVVDGKMAVKFGDTKQGSYSGVDLGSRLFTYSDNKDQSAFYRGTRLGALVGLKGFSVLEEPYGGHDVFYGGLFTGIYGVVNALDQRLDHTIDLAIMPINIGTLGYRANKQTIKSSFGYQIATELFQKRRKNFLEWGGGLSYANYSFALSEKQVNYDDLKISIAARYRF